MDIVNKIENILVDELSNAINTSILNDIIKMNKINIRISKIKKILNKV